MLRGLKILRVGNVVFPLLAAVLWGAFLYRSAYLRATQHVLVQSQLIAQHLGSVIESQRVLHRTIAARLAAETAGFSAQGEFRRYLAVVVSAQPSLRRMQLVSGTGQVLADSDSLHPVPGLLPPDHRDALANGEPLWMGRIITGEGDFILISSAIQVQRRQAVLLSELETDLLQGFLQGIAVRGGQGEAGSISRKDGWLLLRSFEAKPVLLPATAQGRTIPMGSRSGYFEAMAVTDGVTRIDGFHWGRDLPLFANFGVPKLLVWTEMAWQGLHLLALFLLMGLFLWVTAQRMARELEDRLLREGIRERAETADRLAEQRIHLMRETNQRVKNNLALGVSIINLQLRGGKGLDADAQKARIGANSHVHDLMHQARVGVHVDFAAMLTDIAASPAVMPRESGITVRCDLQPGILLGPDRITPWVVIATELITNAVKHAFPGRQGGVIHLLLQREAGGRDAEDRRRPDRSGGGRLAPLGQCDH